MNSTNSKITVFLPTTTIDPRHIAVNADNAANPVNADNPVSFCATSFCATSVCATSVCATMQMQPR